MLILFSIYTERFPSKVILLPSISNPFVRLFLATSLASTITFQSLSSSLVVHHVLSSHGASQPSALIRPSQYSDMAFSSCGLVPIRSKLSVTLEFPNPSSNPSWFVCDIMTCLPPVGCPPARRVARMVLHRVGVRGGSCPARHSAANAKLFRCVFCKNNSGKTTNATLNSTTSSTNRKGTRLVTTHFVA